MKINLLLLAASAVTIVFALTLHAVAADGSKKSGDEKQVVYHVVSIKFKEGAAPEKIKAVEEAFAALKDKIPGVMSLHWGTNVSPEKRNKGYTHCFVLTFANDKDRDGYLVHPAHKEFGKTLGPVLDDVMVIDFWAKE